MKSIWGEGLLSRYYFGQRIALRRNSLVYEVRINLGKFRITIVRQRKQSKIKVAQPDQPIIHRAKPCVLCGKFNNSGHESCDRCFEKLQ